MTCRHCDRIRRLAVLALDAGKDLGTKDACEEATAALEDIVLMVDGEEPSNDWTYLEVREEEHGM